MIVVYAAAGTFSEKHLVAQDLASAVMRWEKVPPIDLFKNNTAGFRSRASIGSRAHALWPDCKRSEREDCEMVLAGIDVVDTPLVHDAIELARESSVPYLFNHAMRSWLFGVVIAEGATPAPDPELFAVSAILHDLGLTARYAARERFEVDSANAARSFLKERRIPAHHIQLVWDAIALHTTRSIALHKEPEVAMTHSGIAVDVIGAGLDLIPQDKVRAILAEFPRLSMKKQFQDSLCGVVRQKPATSYDNLLRDIGTRYVKGYTAPTFTDLLENAPFNE